MVRGLSDLATAAVLLPGAAAGAAIRLYRRATRTDHPPFARRMLELLKEPGKVEAKHAQAAPAQ
jgi:hypothetical protein